MAYMLDADQADRISDEVDDPIGADAKAPEVLVTDQFLATRWTWVFAQASYGLRDAKACIRRERAHLTRRASGPFNRVAHFLAERFFNERISDSWLTVGSFLRP